MHFMGRENGSHKKQRGSAGIAEKKREKNQGFYERKQDQCNVITSYSIHYTKLYE